MSIDAFMLETLPLLNQEALRGNLPVAAFLREIAGPVEKLAAAAQQVAGHKQQAREILGQLGMIVSSAERHAQAAGQQKGAAVAALHLDEVLVELGRVAEHPPRDTPYSLWLWNAKQYGYTASPQEKLFARMMRSLLENLERSCRRLRFLASSEIALRSPAVIEHVRRATELHELNNGLFAALSGREQATSEECFPGSFFSIELRPFLTAWPVAGQLWEGPTLASFAPVWEADLRLSPASDRYRAYLRGRLHTLPGEEQRRLRLAMESPTVEERLLRELSLPMSSCLPLENAHLDERVHTSRLAAYIQTLERYVVAVTLWSKLHLSLVRMQLEESADASAGEGDLRKELVQILELRRNPPVLGRLFEAARRVGKSARSRC